MPNPKVEIHCSPIRKSGFRGPNPAEEERMVPQERRDGHNLVSGLIYPTLVVKGMQKVTTASACRT
jgi:hypothetical protein